MSVGVIKDYKLKRRNLRTSHTLVDRGTGTPKDRDEVNRPTRDLSMEEKTVGESGRILPYLIAQTELLKV